LTGGSAVGPPMDMRPGSGSVETTLVGSGVNSGLTGGLAAVAPACLGSTSLDADAPAGSAAGGAGGWP
jgi:hypothetical protein